MLVQQHGWISRKRTREECSNETSTPSKLAHFPDADSSSLAEEFSIDARTDCTDGTSANSCLIEKVQLRDLRDSMKCFREIDPCMFDCDDFSDGASEIDFESGDDESFDSAIHDSFPFAEGSGYDAEMCPFSELTIKSGLEKLKLATARTRTALPRTGVKADLQPFHFLLKFSTHVLMI